MNEEATEKKKGLSRKRVIVIVVTLLIMVIGIIALLGDKLAKHEYKLSYELKPDGTYKFLGTNGDNGSLRDKENAITVPAEYEGKKVTEVDFSYGGVADSIETLIISEGISTVSFGQSSFSDSYRNQTIKNLTLPSTLTSLKGGDYMPHNLNVTMSDGDAYKMTNNCIFEISTRTVVKGFDGCTVPEGTVSIGARAFVGTALGEQFALPETLMRIGTQAFSETTNMPKLLVFHKALEEVGVSAFSGAKGVETIILDTPIQLSLPNCQYLYVNEDTIPEDKLGEWEMTYASNLVESDMPGYRKLSYK